MHGNYIGTDVTGTAVTGPAGPPVPNFTVIALPETSGTYPVGTNLNGFVSQSDDPIAPWSGTSAHFLGTDVGGSTEMLGAASLGYRYRLEFDAVATLTSISVSGVGGPTLFPTGSGSSLGNIAFLTGGISALVAIAAAGGWFTRRRWYGAWFH